MKIWESVPKRGDIKLKRRGITQQKSYNNFKMFNDWRYAVSNNMKIRPSLYVQT